MNPSAARRHRALRIIVLFLLAFQAGAASSWRVTNWTTDDALPQGTVYAIVQTADRYLWLTTLGGLVRYDGVEFTVFARGVTPGLRSNRFTTLLETQDGSLWAGTEDGFVTRYRDGAFTSWSLDGSLAPVFSLRASDGSSEPWAFTNRGLFIFNGDGFERVNSGIPTRSFLYRTGSAAVDDPGVMILEPRREPRLLPFSGLVTPGSGRGVVADGSSLFIIDSVEGVHEYANGTLRRIDHPLLLQAIREAAATGEGSIGALTRVRDGAFWFAHSTRGIARIDDASIEWITPSDGLASRDIVRIYEDREGTIWATSAGHGISAFRRRAARTYGEAEGLEPAITYPLLARDGALLVGSWGGGVYRFDARRFEPLYPETHWVMSLAEDREGALWISMHSGGVMRIGKSKSHRFSVSEGLPSPTVRVIHRAQSDALWFGTNEGLARFEPEGRFTAWRAPSPDLSFIQTIAESSDGSLLLGTRGGVVRFRDGRFEVLADEGSGLSSNTVRALLVDRDDTIWAGTYDGGINRLREGKVSAITTKHGLFDNGVFAIVEDDGFFWMSSNRGIHRASRRELNAVADGTLQTISSLALTRADGLLSPECNGGVQPAAARTPDGLLWFPTQKGIVSVDPKLITSGVNPPAVHLTSVMLDGEARSLRDEIRIAPSNRRIEFRFAAPTTTASGQIRYRYKLEGFDRDWNEVVGQRSAAYTHIPPGDYRFLVSASNPEGRWNADPAVAIVTALPPFWRTWWFLTTAALAAMLLLWLAHRLRLRSLIQEQAAQVEFSRRLMIQQEEERKRVASELHDSLGQSLLIIKNRALIALDRDGAEASREQLGEISTTAAAAIDDVRRIAHDLRPPELDHLGLTRSIEVLVKRMASSSPIVFSSEVEPVDHILTKEAEVNVFRIVQEWLSNVARHSQATASVVSLTRADDRLRLRIQDDGTGFSRARAEEQGRQGIGLRGIAERVQMMRGTYEIQSDAGAGTTMTVELPLPESR